VTNLTALVFRFRVVIFVSLYLLGFIAPWERHAPNSTLWLFASTWVARTGLLGLAAATLSVTLAALGCLLLGTILRLWGTAYLGSVVMGHAQMHGESLMASGPYRYVRNPLYLGAWFLALGVSILMPPSGAAFIVIAFSIFVLLLIRAEEGFLAQKQGQAYEDYRKRVPRLRPRIRTSIASSTVRPRWLQAMIAETYPVGITICFAIFAWRYNARILLQCVLICYGASLVVRAVMRPGTDLA
jgi:protein-S-isoprenylcysteine O-methyltransferase Ste14